MKELTRARLQMLANLLTILVLFALDVRDLYFKVHMLGPYDSYSFRTDATDMIQTTPIPRPTDTIEMLRNGSATAASGWPSLYSRCEAMYASGSDTSRFFLTALTTNCTIELNAAGNETRLVPQLLITATMRVDTMVVASCDLLLQSQRPAICQDSMVIGYFNRYMMEDEVPTYEEMAQPGSDEEDELLRFLTMVSSSYPYNRVTCFEGIELDQGASGVFRSTIFGCASPNTYRSEWLGFVHKGIAKYLVTKGWLTADVLSVMGIRYGIRQNSIDIYDVKYNASGRLVLRSSSLVNFSSFGHLYAISVLIDIALLIAHFFSAFEVVKWMLRPQYTELQAWINDFEAKTTSQMLPPMSMRHDGPAKKDKPASRAKQYIIKSARSALNTLQDHIHGPEGGQQFVFKEAKFYRFFSGSFYRSKHYLLWTTVTQILSWIIILPNAVVWNWSESATQKIQGYLCSIKSWVLIASCVNFVWNIVVHIDEKRAYKFVKGTYITNPEIIAIGALVAYNKQTSLFAMSGTKYSYELQRNYDFSSFSDGYLGYSNAFNRFQDHVSTTSWYITWVVYKPLVEITLMSVVFIVVYLVAKYILLYFAFVMDEVSSFGYLDGNNTAVELQCTSQRVEATVSRRPSRLELMTKTNRTVAFHLKKCLGIPSERQVWLAIH